MSDGYLNSSVTVEAKMSVRLKPFRVPNYVLLRELPPDAAKSVEDFKIPLKDLDGDTIRKLLKQFEEDVWKVWGENKDRPA
jgi:hypothetical protein